MAKKYGQPRRSEILYDLPEEEGGAEEEAVPDYPCLLYTSHLDDGGGDEGIQPPGLEILHDLGFFLRLEPDVHQAHFSLYKRCRL